MAAFVTQKKTSIISPYHPLQYTAAHPIFATKLPNVVVNFSGTLPTEALEAIRADGGNEVFVQGKVVYLLQNPSASLLRTVASAAL